MTETVQNEFICSVNFQLFSFWCAKSRLSSKRYFRPTNCMLKFSINLSTDKSLLIWDAVVSSALIQNQKSVLLVLLMISIRKTFLPDHKSSFHKSRQISVTAGEKRDKNETHLANCVWCVTGAQIKPKILKGWKACESRVVRPAVSWYDILSADHLYGTLEELSRWNALCMFPETNGKSGNTCIIPVSKHT